MKAQRIIGLFFAAWAMLSLSACGFSYYHAVSQPANPSVDIKTATEFKVRPIIYSKISYKDLGYDSADQMKTEFAELPNNFASAFKDMWKTEGVPEKKITMVGPTDEVNDGILIETEIDKIQLNWSAWSNRPDDYFVTITITDAAKKATLYTGKFQVKNTSFTMSAFGGYGAGAFANRLNNAAYNIVWVLIKIMSNGAAVPADY